MADEQLEKIRHSISHLMSMAVQELYRDVGLGVGPVIEDGFYQDYGLPESISEDLFPKLEKRIKEMIAQEIDFVQHDILADKALDEYKDDPYKTELIKELQSQGKRKVSFYKSDWFENLCSGPHVENTREIDPEAFALTKVAGAYWKGDENRDMLTRIYGVAFHNKKELDEYFERLEQAKKRDHRKLGKDLDLFTFSEVVGKGLPMFTERGATIRRELERAITDEEIRRGYKHVCTPDLANVDLYRKSGHYPYYKDSMYAPITVDDEEIILRPMSCPHHFMMFDDRPRSYRELPLRIAELAKLYRYEKSGELSGLMRVRGFCLADSHIFCTEDQVKDEVKGVIDLIEYFATVFGLERGKDYTYRLSLGDRDNEEKYYKNDKMWDISEEALRQALQEIDAPYYEAEHEAAFYGPKIDIQMKNVLGKEETAFTVQYDFCLPERFGVTYVDDKGKERQPVVVHRSSIGAIERTIAFLIEFYAGEFPLWLSPAHVAVLSVGADHKEYCSELSKRFMENGLRVDLDISNETVGNKIRKASKLKTPYILVIGDKEMDSDNLMVRKRGEKEVVEIAEAEFIKQAQQIISEKSLEL